MKKSKNFIKKQGFSKKEKLLLRHFARYVWWKKADEAMMHEPYRIIASAMCYANAKEEYLKLFGFRKKNLKKALQKAQAGWFDKKSWVFWHAMLFGLRVKIPELPKRGFLCN